MYLFMEDYAFIFIAAIITIGITIMMRAFLITLLELVLINLPAVIQYSDVMVPILLVVQAVLSLVVLYKYISAIDMNYNLVLEKTHQKKADITQGGSNGKRFSFWKTK